VLWLLRVRHTRLALGYPDLPDRLPPRSLAPPLESELDRPCYLPSSAVVRFTLMRLDSSQLRISQLAGSFILWTRAWTILPPAVLYGGAITSHSRVSSVMRRRAYATCSSENLDRFIWSHSFVVDHRSAGDPKQRKSPSTAVLDTVRPGWGNARLLSRL